MIANHKLWLGSDAPHPRPRSFWALAAVYKAHRNHWARFGGAPHTIVMDREFYESLLQECRLMGAEVIADVRTVEGMAVEVEQ